MNKTNIYDNIILNNQRRQQKQIPEKIKTGRIGVLPNIKEEMNAPSTRGNSSNHHAAPNLNRTIYGNYNTKQAFQKNVSKSSHSNQSHNNSNNSGYMHKTSDGKDVLLLQKVNNTINVAMQDDNVKTLKLSLDVENVQLEAEERDQIHISSPVKNKGYNHNSINSK